MDNIPSGDEIHDYITTLLKLWEKTPSNQTAFFNDKRIAAPLSWKPEKVEAVRRYCETIGWIRHLSEGSPDYTLTEIGVSSARVTRAKGSGAGSR